MKTAVVILNWNTRDYLRRWLPGLIGSCARADAAVFVADSASTDGSVDFVRENFPQVRTICLDANYGFTGGYNRAIAQITEGPDAPEYVVLINSDIDVEDGWLEPLTEYMDTHPRCGICGPKLHKLERTEDGTFVRGQRFEYAGAAGGLLTRHGYPFCRGRILSHTAVDKGQYDSAPADVKWITGACMMTRSTLWRELGGLDDRFFAHMEEIDYCWRARRLGWQVTCVPASTVWHLGGGTLPQGSPFKLKLNFRNSLLMLANNLPGEIGPKSAERRIFFRMVLDGVIACIYLLTGRRAAFDAVKEAHKEFKQMQGI